MDIIYEVCLHNIIYFFLAFTYVMLFMNFYTIFFVKEENEEFIGKEFLSLITYYGSLLFFIICELSYIFKINEFGKNFDIFNAILVILITINLFINIKKNKFISFIFPIILIFLLSYKVNIRKSLITKLENKYKVEELKKLDNMKLELLLNSKVSLNLEAVESLSYKQTLILSTLIKEEKLRKEFSPFFNSLDIK